MKILREAVRAILSERFDDDGDFDDEFGHSRDGRPRDPRNEEFEFPVWDGEDNEYTVHAVYDHRLPLEVELWKAVGPDGQEVDLKTLESIVPDLEARAFDFIGSKG